MSSLHFAHKKTPAGEDGYSDSRHLSWKSERVECLLSVVFFVWCSNSLINLKFLRTPFFFSVDCTCKLLFNYFFIFFLSDSTLSWTLQIMGFFVWICPVSLHTHTHTPLLQPLPFSHTFVTLRHLLLTLFPHRSLNVFDCVVTQLCARYVSAAQGHSARFYWRHQRGQFSLFFFVQWKLRMTEGWITPFLLTTLLPCYQKQTRFHQKGTRYQ